MQVDQQPLIFILDPVPPHPWVPAPLDDVRGPGTRGRLPLGIIFTGGWRHHIPLVFLSGWGKRSVLSSEHRPGRCAQPYHELRYYDSTRP